VIAVDPATGVTLAMGAMDPRRPPEEAAAELAPGVRVDPVEPYMMLSGGIRPGSPIPAPADWTEETAREVHATMVDAVSGWHPALRGLVERIELDTMFASNFMRLDPTPPWEPGNVTLVGDAIHAMLPTMGMGGNTARRRDPHCEARGRPARRARARGGDRRLRRRDARVRVPDHGDVRGPRSLRRRRTAQA
jgi:hypothetical protein